MHFTSRTSRSFLRAGGARNRLPLALFLSILFLSVTAPALAEPEEPEGLDAILPENTIFYASLEIEAFTDQYRDLAIARFFADSEVKALGKHIMEVFERKLAETESLSYLVPAMNLAAKITDFGKRISFAVIDVRETGREGDAIEKSGSRPKFVLYLEVSDRERFKEFIRQLYGLLGLPVPALEDTGPGEARIMTLDFSDNKDFGRGLAWVFTGDRFLLANHETTLRRLSSTMQEENRNGSFLQNREDYRRLKTRLQKDGKGLFFALNTRLATAGAPGGPEKEQRDEKPGPLSWVAASSYIEDKLMIDAINLIYAGREGSFRLLDGFSSGIECNAPIPPNAFVYSCFNLNPAILLERLAGFLAREDPWAAKAFEKQLAMITDGTGLNIEELAGAFTGTATLYMRFPRFGYIPNMVGAIPVRDGADLEKRLDKAAAYTGSRQTNYSLVKVRVDRTLNGYYVKSRDGVIYFQPAFCIYEDRLILANSLQELKGAVRWMQKGAEGGENLLQKPEFTEMMKAAGGGAKENLIGAVYLDLGQLLATLYNSFAPLAGMFSREMSFPIDTSLLPPGEVIEKYFDTVVMVVEDVEDGEGRFLSLRSASPVGVTPLFLLTLGSSVFVLLAPAPEEEIIVFEGKNGTGPRYDPVIPSPEGPFMGLLFDPEDPPEPGMYITGIIEDAPAEEVGLLKGDLLLKLGGKEVSVLWDVSRALEGRRPGEELAVVFIRGKERLSATLVLARRGDFTDQ
jgi:hypothetical protein